MPVNYNLSVYILRILDTYCLLTNKEKELENRCVFVFSVCRFVLEIMVRKLNESESYCCIISHVSALYLLGHTLK